MAEHPTIAEMLEHAQKFALEDPAWMTAYSMIMLTAQMSMINDKLDKIIAFKIVEDERWQARTKQ